MEEANKFPAVSHTNVPLLSVVVRHHILEGSQLVGQSLNQLVAQSVSLLGQSVSLLGQSVSLLGQSDSQSVIELFRDFKRYYYTSQIRTP